MTEIVWAMILGPLMWIPWLNIMIGFVAYGAKGGLVGLFVTSAWSVAKGWLDILGVKPDASEGEIKRAYHAKAKAAPKSGWLN